VKVKIVCTIRLPLRDELKRARLAAS